MAKLYAGYESEAEAFVVHKEWACQASPVLKAAFNSDFIERQTQEYRLDVAGIDDDVVHLLVSWIYTRDIDLAYVEVEGSFQEDRTFAVHSVCLVKLWVLADKLLMPRFQNFIMARIDQLCSEEEAIAISMLRYVYNYTAIGSPLRKNITRRCAAATLSSRFCKEYEHFPPGFLIDLTLLLKSKMPEDIRATLIPSMSIFDVSED
jgi:hypothetical protein